MKKSIKTKLIVVLTVVLFGIYLFIYKSGSDNRKIMEISNEQDNNTINVAVLMYHYFNTEEDIQNGAFEGISVEELENDLKYFKEKNICTITSSDLIAYVKGEIELPNKCVMITIDDGHYSIYRDFYKLALEYGCRGNVALVGEYISELSQTRNDDIPRSMWMNWDEIQEIAESGVVEFGSHSNYMHHKDKERYGIKMIEGESPEKYSEVLQMDQKPLIENIVEVCGYSPTFFAYPYSAPQGGYYEYMCSEFGFFVLLNGDEKEWSETRGNIFEYGSGVDTLSGRMIRRFGRYAGDNIDILLNSIWNNDTELKRKSDSL